MAEVSAEAAEASAQPQDPGSISSHERSEEQTNEHEDTMNTSEIPPASELALVTCTSAEPIGISETPSNRTDMVPVSKNTDEKGVSRPSVQMGVHGHENITIAAGDHCTIHLPHSKESQPVTRTDGAEQASHGEDPYAGEAQKCERELRDIYEKDLSNFQTLPWLVGKAIDSVYAEVSLQLKCYGKYDPFDKKDLFTTNKDYRDPRRILIEGDPGYGKTTFCLKLAYDWARHRASFLSHIKLLFYLRLCHFNGKIPVIDFIVDSLLPKGFKIDKEKLVEYIASNQDKVLFVLDGLDEMKWETKCVSNDVEQMLRGHLFRRCKVIATSQTRSLRLKDLLEEEYTWHFHRSLSLVGFERNYGSDFVNKFYSSEGSQGSFQRFLATKDKSTSTVQDLMRSPLNAYLICQFFADQNVDHNRVKMASVFEYVLKNLSAWLNKKVLESRKDSSVCQLNLIKEGEEHLIKILGDNECKEESGRHAKYNKPGRSKKTLSSVITQHEAFSNFLAAEYIRSLCETRIGEFVAKLCEKSTFSSNHVLRLLASCLNLKSEVMFKNMTGVQDLTDLVDYIGETDCIEMLRNKTEEELTNSLLSSAAQSAALHVTVSLNSKDSDKIFLCEQLIEQNTFQSKQMSLTLSLVNPSHFLYFYNLLNKAAEKIEDLQLKINFATKNKILSLDNINDVFQFLNVPDIAAVLHVLTISCESMKIEAIQGLLEKIKCFPTVDLSIELSHPFLQGVFVSAEDVFKRFLKINKFGKERAGRHFSCLTVVNGTLVTMTSSADPKAVMLSTKSLDERFTEQFLFTFSECKFQSFVESVVDFLQKKHFNLAISSCELIQEDYIKLCEQLVNHKIGGAYTLKLDNPVHHGRGDDLTIDQFEELVYHIDNIPAINSLSLRDWKFPDKFIQSEDGSIDNNIDYEKWVNNWKKLFDKIKSIDLSFCLSINRNTKTETVNPLIMGLCFSKGGHENNRIKVYLMKNILTDFEIIRMQFHGVLKYCQLQGCTVSHTALNHMARNRGSSKLSFTVQGT